MPRSSQLIINLSSAETNIGIRNERINEYLFESKKYPVATFSTKIDQVKLDALSVGESTTVSLTGSLDLHGVKQDITTDVSVVKLPNNAITVSTLKPIIVNAKAFDLETGVNKLKSLAKLPSISFAVPVTFSLEFTQ